MRRRIPAGSTRREGVADSPSDAGTSFARGSGTCHPRPHPRRRAVPTMPAMRADRQVELPVVYENVKIDAGYRLDLLVEDTVILELKSIERIPPIHQAQLPSYLKLSGKPVGLLINFNVVHLRDAPGSALRFSRWSLRLAHSSFSIASPLRLAATLSPPFLARRAQFGWAWRSRNSCRQGKLQRLVGTLREGEILQARGR